MATPAAEIDRVLREQNPWHHDGVVPPSLARPVERRMAAVLEGVVESDFVRDTYLGENVLPFRLLPARHSVLPIEGARLIPQDRLDLYPGLAAWWRDAERVWEANSKGRLTLREQLDYRRKLTDQVPAGPHRVLYAASGMHLAAAYMGDPTAIIEHGLYWTAVSRVNANASGRASTTRSSGGFAFAGPWP